MLTVAMLSGVLLSGALVANGSSVAEAATPPQELATIELGASGVGGQGTAVVSGSCNPDGSVALTTTVTFDDTSAANDTTLSLHVGAAVADLGTGSQAGTAYQATISQTAGPVTYLVQARAGSEGPTSDFGSADGTWPACSPETTDPAAGPAAPPAAAPPAAAVDPSTAALDPVPCEGYWKNFWFGKNSVTGTVVIGDKGKGPGERTVTFNVTSTATVPCTVYAQIFTYDGANELPQTSVASTTIVLQPGESKQVELTTNECRIQADLLLTEYETVTWPGMNWDDVIAYDTSTCPPPPPCQTSTGTVVEPGYAVLDGDHVLARTAHPEPQKRAFVAYALSGPTAPADNNDLANIATNLFLGMDQFGPAVVATADNCVPVPVPECRGFAIVEIDATTTPLPRIFLTVTPKALEILNKTGLDLLSLLDINNLDFEKVLEAFLSLPPEDLETLVVEMLKQPGLAMPFYSVNWFSVEPCPAPPPEVPPAPPGPQAAVLAESDLPAQVQPSTAVLPATGANTTSTVGVGLFALFMGVGLCFVARFRKVRS